VTYTTPPKSEYFLRITANYEGVYKSTTFPAFTPKNEHHNIESGERVPRPGCFHPRRRPLPPPVPEPAAADAPDPATDAGNAHDSRRRGSNGGNRIRLPLSLWRLNEQRHAIAVVDADAAAGDDLAFRDHHRLLGCDGGGCEQDNRGQDADHSFERA